MIMPYEQLHDNQMFDEQLKILTIFFYESTLKQVDRLPLSMRIIYVGLLENRKNRTMIVFPLDTLALIKQF